MRSEGRGGAREGREGGAAFGARPEREGGRPRAPRMRAQRCSTEVSSSAIVGGRCARDGRAALHSACGPAAQDRARRLQRQAVGWSKGRGVHCTTTYTQVCHCTFCDSSTMCVVGKSDGRSKRPRKVSQKPLLLVRPRGWLHPARSRRRSTPRRGFGLRVGLGHGEEGGRPLRRRRLHVR